MKKTHPARNPDRPLAAAGPARRIGTEQPRRPPAPQARSSMAFVQADDEHAAERERLRASEEFNRRVLQSSPDCIKVLGLDGRLEFFSVGGLCAMEVDNFDRELRGVEWISVWAPQDRPRVRAAIDAALAGGTGRFEAFCPTAKGTPKWWDVSVSAVCGADGAPEKLLSVSRDITEHKRAELALRETEERYRLAARATNDAIWDWRIGDGHVIWNDAVQALFGHPERETSARWWLDHIHADDRARIEHDIHAVIDGDGTSWSGEYRFVCADGSIADVMDRGFVLRDTQGRAVRMIGAMLDLTEHKRAEQRLRESAERLNIATRAAAIGTWDFDPTSGELRWDARTRALFGLPPEAPVSWDVFVAGLHPEDRPQVEAAVRAALLPDGGGEYDIEYRTVGIADGVERWIGARGKALFSHGRPTRFIGTSVDVTERKRAEQALREADARKDEFLAMLAHELRNPLAPLTNALRLLERTEALSERGHGALAMAARQTGQLRHLVDDLLEVSRITRGKIELKREYMTVGAAIHNAVEAIGAEAAVRGHRLAVELPSEPLWIEADAVRIAQMLGNLLGNACKYTPDGGRIVVGAVPYEDAVEIRVADNGIGIDPHKLPQLFELFHQVDATLDRSAGGLGIGLALVKRLAEMHGGSVRAGSAGRGHGAVFAIRLPLSRAPGGR